MRKNVKTLYLDACDILDSLNIEHESVTSITTNTRYTHRWGTCKYNKRRNEYSIEIADRLMNDEFTYEAAMDTVIHEVLHCHKDRLCHTGEWKRCANLVNREYPQYNIKRCTSNEEKGVADEVKTYKYIVHCVACGKDFKYQRAGGVVKALMRNPHSCTCSCGSKDFIVKEI